MSILLLKRLLNFTGGINCLVAVVTREYNKMLPSSLSVGGDISLTRGDRVYRFLNDNGELKLGFKVGEGPEIVRDHVFSAVKADIIYNCLYNCGYELE